MALDLVDARSYPRPQRPRTPWVVKRLVESARRLGDKADPVNVARLKKYDERKRREALEDAEYAAAHQMTVGPHTAHIELSDDNDEVEMLFAGPVASTSRGAGVLGRPSSSASWSLAAQPPVKPVKDAFDVEEYWKDAKAACTDNTTRKLAAQRIYPVFLEGIGDATTSPGEPVVLLDQLLAAAINRKPGHRFHLVLSNTSDLFSCQYLGQYELVKSNKLLWADIKELEETKRFALIRQLLDEVSHNHFTGSSSATEWL